MIWVRFLLSLLFCSLSNALAFPAPVATGRPPPAAHNPHLSPAQRIEVGGPRPTSPPDGHALARIKRDYTVTIGEALLAPDNTLGYYTDPTYTDDWGYYTCGIYGSAVLVFPNSVASQDGYAGCCYDGECTFAKTCIDSSAYYTASACDADCKADTETYKCTNARSNYCNLLTFATIGVSVWGCNYASTPHVQIFTASFDQTDRTYLTTNLVVTYTGTPRATPTPTNAPSTSNSSGLSQPAKIGVGVGAGVGGLLAIGGIIACLVKAGVFSGAAGAGAAGGTVGAAGAGGATAAAAGGAGAQVPPGDMSQVSQMMGKPGFGTPGVTEVSQPFAGYAPGGEAANFSSPAAGYGPTGAEAGNFSAPGGPSGYGPTGGEFINQGATPYAYGPTGAETGNLTAPGYAVFGPTGAEGANFSAPGGAPGASFGVPPNAAYLAAPAGVVPFVAGAALLGRRKEVGSPPSSPLQPGMVPHSQMQPGVYAPAHGQHELGGGDVYRGAELGTAEASYVSPQSTGVGSYVSPQSTGMGSYRSPQATGMGLYGGNVSEMGSPEGSYAAPAGPPPGSHQHIHELPNPTASPPAELGGYYEPYGSHHRE